MLLGRSKKNPLNVSMCTYVCKLNCGVMKKSSHDRTGQFLGFDTCGDQDLNPM